MTKLVDSQGNEILDTDRYIAGKANATYANSSTLYTYLDFNKDIDKLIISLNGIEGTPRDQINNYYVEFPYNGNPKRACIFVKGGGFVQAHAINVNYLAVLKD